MTKIALIDLFSGIGGFAEGFRRAGLEFKYHAFSEIAPGPISIYKKHFPEAEELGDVTTISDFSRIKNQRGGYHWSLLLDSLAKIYPLLAKGEVLKASAAACSLRQSELSENCDLMFLSLKMSKDCLQVTEDATLSAFCKRLPTLGVMTANGNLSILTGFYPKIASGFTLSDVLEPFPDAKYFLSETATKRLLSYQTSRLSALQPPMATMSETDRMLLKVNGYKKSSK